MRLGDALLDAVEAVDSGSGASTPVPRPATKARAARRRRASADAWRGLRFENVGAGDLRREESLPGWRPRLTGAELTRTVFGDPQPGRARRRSRQERGRG